MKVLRLANLAGKLNRVPHMKKISGKEVMKMEPSVNKEPLVGLYTPTTAYVDGYGVTIALAENAAMNGVKFNLGTEVVDVITKKGKVQGVITNKGIYKGTYVIKGIKVEGVYEVMSNPGGLTRNIIQCLNDYNILLNLSTTVVQIHGKKD